jgi:1,2-diacylglycerol 3-beta-galactosyltransferase
MPDLYKLEYQVTDEPLPNYIIERGLIVLLFDTLQKTLRHRKPDAVIVTNPIYSAPLNAVIALNRWSIPFLTVITDLTNVHRQWFVDGADMLLLPTQEVFDQARGLGFPEERLAVTGIPVKLEIAHERRSPQEIRMEFGWRDDLITVLAVGSKRVKNLEKVLHVLNHSGLPLQLVLVAGGDEARYTHFHNIDWHVQTYCYDFVDQMPAFLRAADLLVTKAGGLIVSEALASGLPLLLIDITPGQEEGNADYVVGHEAGEIALEPVKALETVFHWLEGDQSLLAERAGNALALGRPGAAFDAATLAWQIAERGRARSPRMSEQALARIQDLLGKFNIPIEVSKSTG